MKILHCADLHLDSPLRGLEADPDAPAARIRGATREAFDNLVRLAIDETVSLVLIAGDLFDGDWQDWGTGQYLLRGLEKLTRAGIHVVAISGNHDAESVITRKLRWPDGARLLSSRHAETADFPDLGVAVHGRSFANRAVMENLVPGYPRALPERINIGLLHTSASGGRDEHENYAPCSLDHMRALEYQYWALGHVHTRETLCEDPWVVFPGNIQGRHARESGARGAMLLTVEDGRILPPEHRALDVVRWETLEIDLSEAADEDAVLGVVRTRLEAALLGAEGRLLAARINLHGACAVHGRLVADPSGWREKIRGEAISAGGDQIWVEKINMRTHPSARAQSERPEAVRVLIEHIEAAQAGAAPDDLRKWATTLLDKGSFLRTGFPDDHPLVLASAGRVSESAIEQARAMLLADLESSL